VIGARRPRSALILAVTMGSVVLAVACSAPRPPPAPPPIPVIVATTNPVTTIDYSTDQLAPVGGQETLPSISVTPGQASLSGTVTDENGAPVAGAVVQLQRIVGTATAQAEYATNSAGAWTALGLGGGLYRVRAWRAPDLAQTTPQVLFLAASDVQTVNLTVNQFTGFSLQASIAPSPPIIGRPADIAVDVIAPTVGDDGVVRSVSQPAMTVELVPIGNWILAGNPTTTTSATGVATWQATCGTLGDQPLSVLVNVTESLPLSLPACSPVPTTTTSGAPGASTTTGPGSPPTTGAAATTTG
jgi:hypothetical protein